ncbi:hypothetical protein [Streptomyces clavuligerus]|uniref:hypothetical protein n=1 Tax=Streptomyces clavuligerus TaxID=1901 RepID=UPI00020D90B2|nr:hypothetical protein [Streptomyces clavuligerus]MBY6306742.1 hypothetical protein [Streptomyces clavuligerus]QPJ97310.1 hypothetical protein GE265_29900 [Streptomyces clavuligerus]WDN57365.1 hypothetical protein LL058_36950 [Streptomyces clavuligerus]
MADHDHTDDACPVDVVAGRPRRVGRAPVLSNSFGFGSLNACLVIAPGDLEGLVPLAG